MRQAAEFVAASVKKQVPLAFFVGAGISKSAPSSLPLWPEFRDALLTALFNRLARDGCLGPTEKDTAVHDLLTHLNRCTKSHGLKLRPEVVLECLSPHLSQTLWAMLRVFAHGNPNRNHRVLARLATSSRALLATCNFDILIEKASSFKLVSYSTARRTRCDRSFRDYVAALDSFRAGSAPLLLKIHGCASAPATVKATLSHVSRPVPCAQRDALYKFVEDRLLVVAGYRGDDCDILPEIAHAAASSRGILWLARTPLSVPEVMRNLATRVAWGDLDDFFGALSKLLDIGGKVRVAAPTATLAHQLEQAATMARPIDVCLGLSDLATHIGCWSAVNLLAGHATTLTSDPRLRALAWMSLGDAKRREDPRKALRYFELATRVLFHHASRHPRDYGHCLKYLAAQKNLLGSSAAALKVNARAIGWIKKSSDRTSLARAFDDRANILRRLGDTSAALKLRYRAIDLLERAGDRLNLPMVYNNLGKDYDARDDFSNAEKWWRKALDMKERESSNAPDIGRGRFNLAELLRHTGRPVESLPFMAGAWRNARIHRDRVIQARALYGLAALAHEIGKNAQAQRLLRTAASAAQSAPDWNAYPGRQDWAAGIREKILRSVRRKS